MPPQRTNTRNLLMRLIAGLLVADASLESTSSPPGCVVYVSTNGSDFAGSGSIDSPIATPGRALELLLQRFNASSPAPSCDARAFINVRSGVYELQSTLQVGSPIGPSVPSPPTAARVVDSLSVSALSAASAFPDGLTVQTHPDDLVAGLPQAVLSGGTRLPWGRGADADGVFRADLQSVRPDNPADRIFTLFVNGARRQRVRSELLHWTHSISKVDPCPSCDENRFGFVFANDTFPGEWDLGPSSTSSWLLVSFHQWATGVHTVRSINTTNHTLFVNEPVYAKYAFDNNAAGAQRFYVENVPELPLQPGQWRVLPNKTLEYRLLPSEVAAGTELDVVVPRLPTLLTVNGTANVALQSLTLAHTEWLLTTSTTTGTLSWRDRVDADPGRGRKLTAATAGVATNNGATKSGRMSASTDSTSSSSSPPPPSPPPSSSLLRGSGPLPVDTQMMSAVNADGLLVDNCTILCGGANGLYVAHSDGVVVTRSMWTDFGASAVATAVTDNVLVSHCRIRRPGQLWKQGLGVEFGHCTNATVTRCELSEHPSDGVSFSGVGLVFNNTLSHTLLRDFGTAGVRDPHSGNFALDDDDDDDNYTNTVNASEETISDWGGIHTAHPNVTGLASHVHHNVFANFSSFAIGAYSLYFDFGSCGCNATQNLAYNTGAGVFFNSNGEEAGLPGTWQYLADNIIAFDHWDSRDFNEVVKWRSLAPNGSVHRNIFFAARGLNHTGDLKLFHDHTATQPHQWVGQDWDDNLYFQEGEAEGGFGNTWPGPGVGNLAGWRGRGEDVHSLVGVDPLFVDPANRDFRLQPASPALLQLGFQAWNYSDIGPACGDPAVAGSVVCGGQ